MKTVSLKTRVKVTQNAQGNVIRVDSPYSDVYDSELKNVSVLNRMFKSRGNAYLNK